MMEKGVMTTLTLVSAHIYPLQPLVESALANEVRLLEVALRQTEARLRAFEAQYHLATSEFVTRYADGQIDETLDTIEWLGEQRMLTRIRQKIDTLRGVHFAN